MIVINGEEFEHVVKVRGGRTVSPLCVGLWLHCADVATANKLLEKMQAAFASEHVQIVVDGPTEPIPSPYDSVEKSAA